MIGRSALATVTTSAARKPRDRETLDWYKEPSWAVDALLDAERFFGSIHDPACGGGNIPDRCRARGLHATGSDLVDRGWPDTGILDFTKATGDDFSDPPTSIVCNPPFELAEYFVRSALAIAKHKVAMLLRWSWCEGGTGTSEKSKLRRWALEQAPLSRVYVFAPRVSMPPAGQGIEAKGGAVAFGWLVWNHDHRGPATFGRLHRPEGA